VALRFFIAGGMPGMKSLLRIFGCWCALLVLLASTGCSRYWTNRYYDFRDTYALGAGVTAENPKTGVIPPSLGLYVQVTDFLHLGAITHNGYTAESDLRGSFVGPESYTKLGFLMWQSVRKNQDYEAGDENYFKKAGTPWANHMESLAMSHNGRPAKRLHYEHWANFRHNGIGLQHRGWQYWGYTGFEAAICEPLVTHFGFMLRAGIDISEFSDFLVGFTTLDFKHDDMTPDMYTHYKAAQNPEAVANENPTTQTAQAEQAPANAPVEGARPGDVVDFPELKTIYFDYDKSNIRADQKANAEANLKYLLEHTDAHVLIEGNCDERGTTEYNMALGLRRANAMRDYFTKGGVAADRISVQSFGEERPSREGQNEDAWKWNRRDDFKRVVTMKATN
jgi:peptidoglycan-associated lipoprotein